MSFGFGFGFTKITAAIRAAFSPSSLFAANEPGIWYDPSDLSTLYQDSDGTTPVTAVEQPVGLMLDKSGRGNHASQPTATSRPVLRQDGSGKHYLYFDGVDDFLVTPTIMPGTDKAQVFAGVRKLSDAAIGTVVELSTTSSTNNGSIGLFAPATGTASLVGKYLLQTRGTSFVFFDTNGFVAPITNVLTGLGNISGDSAILRVNGAQAASSTSDQGTGNYLAYPLYIGRRGGTTLPFNGHLYSLVLRFGSNLPIETIEQTEAWINSKTGAY